ncbi:hypothetical protein ACYIU4_002818 [Clostridium botulinum]
MKQNDFRKPVVYILDQELRRRDLKNKIKLEGGEEYKGELPEYPVKLIRDNNKKVIRCIYAEGTSLEWSEELIRNTEGRVYRLKIVFPNKTEELRELYDDDGDLKLDRYDNVK